MVVAFVNVLEVAADEAVSRRWSDVHVWSIYFFGGPGISISVGLHRQGYLVIISFL